MIDETTRKTYEEFAEFLKAQATHRRYAAGMNGEHGDGGASVEEFGIECFTAGLAQKIPRCWQDSWNKFNSTDYQKYLELREKFAANERGKPRDEVPAVVTV